MFKNGDVVKVVKVSSKNSDAYGQEQHIKAGITNGDGVLTQEGQEVFMTWLLQKHGAEFKTEVVDKLPKEDEE